jgi:excisionase family DNA binding protein
VTTPDACTHAYRGSRCDRRVARASGLDANRHRGAAAQGAGGGGRGDRDVHWVSPGLYECSQDAGKVKSPRRASAFHSNQAGRTSQPALLPDAGKVDADGHRRLDDVNDIAPILKLNLQTVRNWIDRGEHPAMHVGRGVRIRRTDFDVMVEAGYSGPRRSPVRPEATIWDGVNLRPVMPTDRCWVIGPEARLVVPSAGDR